MTHADERTRWLALYVLCAGMLMIVLDITIVNVALPSIQDSLGFSQSNLAWVVNGYLVPFGGLLLLAGRLGDLLGQRRIFLTGLAVFTTASLLCGLSQTLFRSRNVSGANALQMLLVAGMFSTFFLGALYLQQILGYNPLEVGLAFLPTTLVMGGLSLGFSERLIMRFGPRNVLIPGMALTAAALLLFARTPVDGCYLPDLLPPLLLMGVGIGISFSSLMTLAMSGATPSDAGLASGIVNTSAQVGGAIGLAVLATLAAERTSTLEDGGASVSAALNSGFHLAYLVAAGLVGVALAIAIFVLRSVPMPDPAAMAEPAPGEEPQGAPEPAYSEAG